MSTSIKSKMGEKLIVSGILVAILLAIGWVCIEWGYNRVYVYEGTSVQLTYRGPNIPIFVGNLPNAGQNFAEVDKDGSPLQKGVLEHMLGPGRHFYCPIWWKTKIIDDYVINEGEVGIVESLMGKELPPGEFLVDGDIGTTDSKGILRKVLIPGRYRINTFGYKVEVIKKGILKSGDQEKHVGWVTIPTGYVGVVTNLSANPITKVTKGVQKNVLSPGIYPVNPNEQHIDIVEIGYREHSIKASLVIDKNGQLKLDESG